MAFDFGDVIDFGARAFGLFKLSQDRELPPAAREAEAAARAAREYADAALNPDSPQFKNLHALEEARVKRDLVASIEEIMRANRRAAATGRVGFSVNPERRDEFRSQAVARGFAEAGGRASKITADKLNAASQMAARGAAALTPAMLSQMRLDDINARREGSFAEGLRDALKGVHRTMGGSALQNVPAIGQSITWWPNSAPSNGWSYSDLGDYAAPPPPMNNWSGASPGLSTPDIRRDHSWT